MEALMLNMRLLAGVMFWAFVDLFLVVMWLAVIIGLGIMLINGARADD